MRLKLNVQVRFDLVNRSSVLFLQYHLDELSEKGDLQIWTGSNSARPLKERFLYVCAQQRYQAINVFRLKLWEQRFT